MAARPPWKSGRPVRMWVRLRDACGWDQQTLAERLDAGDRPVSQPIPPRVEAATRRVDLGCQSRPRVNRGSMKPCTVIGTWCAVWHRGPRGARPGQVEPLVTQYKPGRVLAGRA